MRFTTILATGTALAAFATAGAAHAAEPVAATPPTAAATTQAAPASDTAAQNADAAADGDIVVTARQREESLKDVPIAITALSGAELKDRQVNTVRDIAAYTPGLNINSDSVGRAFVSIRGIGTTLIDTVQPGVGIFIDGVYQPNTSYLNSPIVDVARIEVLRGPQGTLFGNNTLGGAINVVTRQPGNHWEGRFDATAAGPDNYYSVSGTISGPIVRDLLAFRLGASYHAQDGFQENTLAHGSQNPLEQKSISGALRFTPASWATFTLNANYDRVEGGNTPYMGVAGPTDYTLDGITNQLSRALITYKGVNLKSEFDVDSLHTKITLVGAYDQRDVATAGDGDFGPVDFIRSSGNSRLITKTGELRFDTQWSDSISTLVGFFANRSTVNTASITNIIPLGASLPATTFSQNDQRAVFGTAFVKLGSSLDLAIGGRYDHQRLLASQTGPTYTAPTYLKDQFQPRVTLTEHWTSDVMTYASVAKGIRGGGQNGPGTQPQNALYQGDSVWTYEVGTKFSHGGLSLSADIFYNDYRDFIGQNALAPKVGGGFVAINLNTGKVKSYGAEIEAHWRVTPNWRIDLGGAYVHARITDDSEYFASTGVHVSTDRIIFTPDYNFNASTTYTVPIDAKKLFLDAGVYGKGSRIGATLDPAVAPRLAPYAIVNASATIRFASGFSIGVFGTNLFNAKFIESYIDKSALVKAGLAAIAQNLAIQGDRRRYGVRASFKF